MFQTRKPPSFVPAAASVDAQTLVWQPIPRRFRITEAQRRALLVPIDVLLLLLGVLAAATIVQVQPGVGDTSPSWLSSNLLGWAWVIFYLGLWVVFGALTDLYDLRTAHHSRLTVARMAIVALFCFLAIQLLALYFAVQFNPDGLLLALGSGFVLVLAWRLLYAAWLKSAVFECRTLILGTGAQAQRMAQLLQEETGLRHSLLGYVGTEPSAEQERLGDIPLYSHGPSFYELARTLQTDKVIVAPDGDLGPATLMDLIACQTDGIRVCSITQLYDQVYAKIPVREVDGSWLLETVMTASHGHRYRFLVKRGLDLMISLLALPWFMLIFPLLALAIKLDSSGPVFYRQVRTGLGGKPFEILKFRTMYTDAEKDGRPRWASKDDPRITRLGRIMRKSRLDEIPQFINILRGDMSLIGPRPERPEFVEQLEKEVPNYALRLLVPPGLTGWAQIKYTYGNSIEDARIKLEYDTYYVRHWSVWMDIYILFQTVSVVLRAKGT